MTREKIPQVRNPPSRFGVFVAPKPSKQELSAQVRGGQQPRKAGFLAEQRNVSLAVPDSPAEVQQGGKKAKAKKAKKKNHGVKDTDRPASEKDQNPPAKVQQEGKKEKAKKTKKKNHGEKDPAPPADVHPGGNKGRADKRKKAKKRKKKDGEEEVPAPDAKSRRLMSSGHSVVAADLFGGYATFDEHGFIIKESEELQQWALDNVRDRGYDYRRNIKVPLRRLKVFHRKKKAH